LSSEGGCSLSRRIMTLAKGVVALLFLIEGGCSLTSRIMTLAKGDVALLVPHALYVAFVE